MHEYKTFEQQIDILKERGLIINNIEYAKEILSIHNYYNIINGYKNLCCYTDEDGNEKFINGANSDEKSILLMK